MTSHFSDEVARLYGLCRAGLGWLGWAGWAELASQKMGD